MIYNIQEVYPDLLVKERNIKNRLILAPLEMMERFIYNGSDAVTTIHETFYNTVLSRIRDKSKLHIIPNFVDTSLYRPLEKAELQIDRSLFPKTDSLKVMFAGNIGIAQDWELLLSLAAEVIHENIEFYVIGEGVKKSYLETCIREEGLQNIHVVPYQDRTLIPSLIAYGDLHFIFMAPNIEGFGFPSKVYTIMACSKPMLIASGENTPIVKYLRETECAFILDDVEFSRKIEHAVSILGSVTRATLEESGGKGFEIVSSKYSSNSVTDMYVGLADSLVT